MWHEQVRELAQAVMAQRTEVEVFLVSSLQLVSARCSGCCALQPCQGSPGACNDTQARCDRLGHLPEGMVTEVFAQLMWVHPAP